MDKSLSSKIFIGLFAGLVLGTAIQYLFSGIAIFDTYLLGTAEGVGGMFVSLIKLLVVPLVYVSIVCGIVDLKDISAFGRLGGENFYSLHSQYHHCDRSSVDRRFNFPTGCWCKLSGYGF